MSEEKVFTPQRQHNPLWGLGGTGLLAVLVMAVPSLLLRRDISTVALVVPLGLIVALFIYGVVLWKAWRRMAYVLGDAGMELRMKPLRTYRIAWDEIVSLARADLGESVLASHSWKGLVVFGVRYRGWGKVRMCATRSTDVVVIKTQDGKLFGVTPAEESAFVEAVTARVM